eukprot:m.62595 g.62595  ORF g.62595 m.62595 type:complete len:320 (-) comp8039_c0_seq1:2513-3472(-)
MVFEVDLVVEKGVVFAGENVSCVFTIKNIGNEEEAIALASIQCLCQCSTNASRFIPLPQEQQQSTTSFTFSPFLSGGRSACVYASQPIILFCDEFFPPGESRSYPCSLPTSSHAPPSYKGESISYSYRIDGGVQQIGKDIKHVTAPIRVLFVDDQIKENVEQEEEHNTDSATPRTTTNSDTNLPSNSSHSSLASIETQDVSTLRDEYLRATAALTRKRKPLRFQLRNSKQEGICMVQLEKVAYRLGETIMCLLDFSCSDVHIVKVHQNTHHSRYKSIPFLCCHQPYFIHVILLLLLSGRLLRTSFLSSVSARSIVFQTH